MRIALLVVVLGSNGCTGTGLVAKPLPELVATQTPTAAIEVPTLQLPVGEALVWDVRYHGMTIGRAEMSTGETEVGTKFETGALASSIASIHYDATTVLDRSTARPRSARETLARDGTTVHHIVAFDRESYTLGEPAVRKAVPQGAAHTLHTALGTIRAWAGPEAVAGFLFVVHGGRVFHLTLARPTSETLLGSETLKIACRIRPQDGAGDVVTLSIWLTADATRIPLRIAIAGDAEQLTAQLIDE